MGIVRVLLYFFVQKNDRVCGGENADKLRAVCRMKELLLPGRSCRVFGSLVCTDDFIKGSANRKNEAEEECGQ